MADEKDNSGGIISSAIIAAPTVAGAAVAGSRIRSAWEEISAVATPARVPQIRDAVRRFAEEYTSGRTPWKITSYIKEIGQIAETMEGSDAMTESLGLTRIREIAQRIASKSDPTGRIGETLVKRLETAGSGVEALKAINMYLSGTSSIYAQRFAGMFSKDLSMLSSRVAAGLPIETVGWTGKIPRVRTAIPQANWPSVLGSRMSAELSRIQRLTDAEIGVEILSRKDIAGEQINLFLQGGRVPGRIKLKIPRVLKNQYLIEQGPLAGMGTVVKSGSTQQSRRIAGVYGVVEGGALKSSFNFEEWSLYRFNEEVLPHIMNNSRLNQREVNRIIREHEQQMLATAEWTHSVKSFSSVEEYIKSRSGNIHLFQASQDISPVFGRDVLNWPKKYAPVDIDTLAGLIEAGGLDMAEGAKLPLYPGFGPTQAAGGIASLRDPRVGVGLMPSAVPTAKRPMQFNRANWSPSASAIRAMAANPINEQMRWAAKEVGIQTPILKSAFVSSRYQHILEGTGLHAEGQFLLTRRRAEEMAMDEISQIKIDAARIGPDLASLIDPKRGAHWNINKTLPEGALLGYSPEGNPVTLSSDMTLLHGTVFGDKQEGTFLRLAVTKPRKGVNFAKYQGIKATAALAKEEQLLEVLQKVSTGMPPGFQASASRVLKQEEIARKSMLREGLGNLEEDLLAGETGEEALLSSRRIRQGKTTLDAGVDAIFMMDELKKNRSLHYNQMFTALWDFNRIRMGGNLKLNPEVATFQNDPLSWINKLEKATSGLPASERDIYKMREIVSLAQKSALTPEEMAGVFAAVPEAMSDVAGIEEVLGTLSQKQQRAIRAGTAVGYTQLYFAGAGPETGAGGHAPLEPRTLELLQGPAWGELGPQVQEDIMRRMIAAYPERLFEQKELITSLSSMRDMVSRSGAMTPEQMLEMAGKELLPMQGASLSIKGLGDIYIPGASTIRQLASYQTPSGKIIDMPLAHAYRDLMESARAYGNKDITRDVMQKKISDISTLVSRATMGTITGKGGLARNKMPASAYLRTEDIAIGMEKLTADIGVSESIGERMFREMEGMDIYGKAEIDEMRERFRSGGSVAGLMQRDPSIGPYSVQAVTIQKLKGAGRAAVFREQRYKAFARSGMFTNISEGKEFLAEARRALAAGEGTDIRLSPLVGAAGDFDADNVSLIFSGPQLEESLRRKAGNTMEYEDYIIRQQMLKAKAPAKVIEAAEDMAESIYSLSVTGGEQIGKLSVRLQEYRAGVLMGAGGLTRKEGMNALSLLEWMEQVPISAKHVEKGRAAELPRLLEEIRTHLSRGDVAGISEAARIVMKNAKDANMAAMLKEGVTVALEGPTGAVGVRRIPGLNLDEAARNIVRARQAMSVGEEGQMVMGRIRQLFMEQGPKVRAEEAFSVLGSDFAERSPFGALLQAATSTPSGPMTELSRRALSAKNRMAALGKGMIAHTKPLAMGLGISLGLSLLLSEPPRILEPGANVPPQPNMRGASGGEGQPTNLHPEGRVSGAPTAPDMTGARQTARVTSAENYNVNIRGRTGNKIDYGMFNSQMRYATGGRSRVHTHIRDTRSSLTPQKLSSIIQGR